MDYLLGTLSPMMRGLAFILKLFAITLVLSIPLGLLLALLRLSGRRAIDFVVGAYVRLMRGTPLMLQLLFVYFALPAVRVTLSDFRPRCWLLRSITPLILPKFSAQVFKRSAKGSMRRQNVGRELCSNHAAHRVAANVKAYCVAA